MSPNRFKLKLTSKLPIIFENGTTTSRPISTDNSSVKEFKRDEIFTRFQKPFGIEMHTFNLWMMYIIPSAFSLYFLVEYFTFKYPFSSILLWTLPYGYLGGLGVTCGSHRFWTHKSFKANLPLQIILMCMQTISMQYPIHKWCLDHRLHHKYTDTDSDPHNSKKGLYHTQMAWWYRPQTKEFQEKVKTFEMPDLENDPVVRFQSRYYWTLAVIFQLVIPVYVLRTIWGLPFLLCIAQTYMRYTLSIHVTSMVNSFAHAFGDKPFYSNISSFDNIFVSFFTVGDGEGWHNYHHTFPWDYKAAEFGWKVNFSTMFIDFFAAIGWAWDLITVSPKMLEQRIRRTGDGTRYPNKKTLATDHSHDKLYWGWDDDAVPNELRELTDVIKSDK